jgi:phenylalanine-4-hydroxylase
MRNNARAAQGQGLTTTEAPFIAEARSRGRLFIEQPFELYSGENHSTWRRLYSRIHPLWQRYANPNFLEGLDRLGLPPDRIPKLGEVNHFLSPLTGFKARAVSGYVPAFVFFDSLRNRAFPTTITIRHPDKLDYLPEPDIFHDLAGHVPMHTDRAFAETLVRFGDCAHAAAERAAGASESDPALARLSSILRAMARFFWFTVEFGLMRSQSGGSRGVCAYGSGLLSSYGELAHSVESEAVERRPLRLEEVVQQPFRIDSYQPLLYVAESFDQIYEMVGELENWMRAGKLDDVAAGEPAVSAGDLRSFLDPAVPVQLEMEKAFSQ